MEESIRNFIKKAVKEIQDGLPEGFEISNEIEFDISRSFQHTARKLG